MAETPTMLSSTAASSTYVPDLALSAMNGAAPLQDRRYGGLLAPTQAHRIGVPMAAAAARRIIQVFIADSNENIPLDDCVLYKGEQKLTDATDQELFFELDIKSILEAHNAKRTKIVDKKIKDRTEYLEAAKVRDLKMVVVTIASL